MSNARHTPGPWVVEIDMLGKGKKARPVFVMVVAERGGMPGLIVHQGEVTPTDLANAALIAAAPDMLAALEGVVRVADRDTDEFNAARAAIRKAKEGQ